MAKVTDVRQYKIVHDEDGLHVEAVLASGAGEPALVEARVLPRAALDEAGAERRRCMLPRSARSRVTRDPGKAKVIESRVGKRATAARRLPRSEAGTEHRLLGRRAAGPRRGRVRRGRAARLRLGLDRRGLRLRRADPAGLVGSHDLAGPAGHGDLQIAPARPPTTAMAAMTMDHLTGGRVILGLGAVRAAGRRGLVRPAVREAARADAREYVEILRGASPQPRRTDDGRSPTELYRCRTPDAPGSASR